MRIQAALVGTILLFAASAFAQDVQSTFCNFDDENQISIQYTPVVKDPPRFGKVWSPGVTLYVQTPLTLGGSTIALGAYSVHFLPEKKNWTIVVNKNVNKGATYDPAQDVARAPMEIGELPSPEKNLQLAFGHMPKNQCSLRVYYQKTGAFAEFDEKK